MDSSPRPVLTVTLWLALVALGVATLFALLARAHWIFALFANFPLQYAVGLTVCLAGALALKRFRLAIVAACLLLPNLLAVSYYFPAAKPAAVAVGAGPADFRLVLFNVLTSNRSYAEVLAYLQESEADLIMLNETSAEWIDALAPLREDYPHLVTRPRSDNFGIALFSKLPFKSQRIIEFESFRAPVIEAVVEIDGRPVTILGAHPIPPVGAHRSRIRDACLRELAKLAADTTPPLVVAGDLNATVWSPSFRDLLKTTGLLDSGRKRGFQSTWHRTNPLFSIPIDHVLHSSDLRCTSRTIGPALGSDHRPLVVDFAIE